MDEEYLVGVFNEDEEYQLAGTIYGETEDEFLSGELYDDNGESHLDGTLYSSEQDYAIIGRVNYERIQDHSIYNHEELKGRELKNQHPISAITGLERELERKQEALVSSNLKNKIKIENDKTMSVNSIGVEKLSNTYGVILVLNGGGAPIY